VETDQSHAATYPARQADYGKDLAALLDVVSMSPASAQDALLDPLAVLAGARGGEADAVLAGIDVLAVPTQRQPPYTIAEAEKLYERSDLIELETRAAAQNVAVFNLTGQRAISVPCGFSSDGMPVGLMLAAGQWDELTVLRAARAYEQVRGPSSMPPI
jgi:Asp-tRNA(Asn)/Glu-tRNA(Gln) amidotransferase A subunit family amidase